MVSDRLHGSVPSLKNILRCATVRWLPKQLMIGPVVKQYGPFRLHRQTHILIGGRLRNLSRCFVVVGELAVPLFLTFGVSRDDPQGYANVVKERHGPFRECVYVGDIPIKRSTARHLYDHVDRWLNYKQTAIECYAAQHAVASDASTGNSRRSKFYCEEIMKMEAEHQIVRDAFRAFMLEYPDAATATKRNAAIDKREARRARKTIQKGIWLINRVLK